MVRFGFPSSSHVLGHVPVLHPLPPRRRSGSALPCAWQDCSTLHKPLTIRSIIPNPLKSRPGPEGLQNPPLRKPSS